MEEISTSRGNETPSPRKRTPTQPATSSPAGGILPHQMCSYEDESSLKHLRFSPCRRQRRFFVILLITLFVFSAILLQDNGDLPVRQAQSIGFYAPKTTYKKSRRPDYGGIIRRGHCNVTYNEYREELLTRIDRDLPMNALVEEYWSYDDCRPPAFAESFYPTCNSMHEGDYVAGPDSYQQGSGYSRQAWIVNHTINSDISALKLLKLEHADNLNMHHEVTKEAIIMEQLSASNRIMNMYSHCGTSLVVEYMPYSLEDLMTLAAVSNVEKTMSSHLKLRVALEMAESLADLHGFGKGVVVHGDLQEGQWLHESLHGRLVLGDFNLAKILFYSSNEKEYCKTKNGRGLGSNRSPEEVDWAWLDEKIDVYTLCNLYYSILTGHSVDLPKTVNVQEQKEIMTNYTIGTSSRYKNASLAESTLAGLLPRCWETEPSKRISVFEIVKYLREATQNGPDH